MTGEMTLVDRHAALGYINAGLSGVGDFIAHDRNGDGVIDITWLSDRQRPTEEELANARWPDPRDEIAEQIDFIRWVTHSDLAEQALSPVLETELPEEVGADAWKFPAPDDRLSDWETVGDVGPEIPADLAQLMLDDEPLSDAVARMTPSLDELLDMAQVLSDASLERAASALSPESIEDWTERLWVEKARLRTKRGTDDENLSRENLISRVTGTFTRVGAKR